MKNPLVSVICLCYNHAQFVAEAIDSVLGQRYHPVQLIIVDDASTDGSQDIIRQKVNESGLDISLFLLDENIGNCKAFNLGYRHSTGQYIIDLAADDILHEDRIQTGVRVLGSMPDKYGIHYCEAQYIDEKGKPVQWSAPAKPTPYEGDIYRQLIRHYWINPATMLIKRAVLQALNGYDESLSYEDFDFWVRSARQYHYAYSPNALVKKRIVKSSLGAGQNRFRNEHEYTTFRVCQKIKSLNRMPDEDLSLRKRIRYEIRRCLLRGHIGLSWQYLRLYYSI